jgi:hypothetical protein
VVVGLWVWAVFATAVTAADGFVPTSEYESRHIEGWSVRVNKALLASDSELGKQALRVLELKLGEINRVVPAKAAQRLHRVTLWVGVNDGHAPCAEYHPSKKWLAENGYNPDKAKCVEIGNASRFIAWSLDQPMMILHELAHAYHDQFLGHDFKPVRAAYQAAVSSKKYESVLRANGKHERAYAMTNLEEYFAEGTEAFFGANDFYPFVRAELREHDAALFRALEEAWGVKSPSAKNQQRDAP